MASLIKAVFNEIMVQGRTITDYEHVAVWNDQLNRMENAEGLSLPFPALYVEIIPQEYNALALGVTSSDLSIRLHVCHQQLDAGDGTFDQNLDVFDLRDKTKIKFQLFKPSNCGSMIQVGEEQDYEHGNVYHYILEFKTHFIDTKGSPLDPTDGTWIEHEPPTELVVNYQEQEKNIFTDEFTNEFE